MRQRETEKRTLANLRRIIDAAPLMQKATLRSMARMLGIESLRPLDVTLGRLNDDGKSGMMRC
jgi:hypothetical protein